jgi:bla regulator protein BlaR1
MQALLKALSWTFLHSFWQGLIAALLAAIVISSTRRSTAKLRYNLLGTILLVFLTATVVTFTEMLNQQQLEQAATGIAGPLADGTLSPSSASTADGGFAASLRVWFDNNAGVLMLAWMLFFLLNCLKLATGLATVRRLRYYKTSPVGDEWMLALERLKINMKISQPVLLLYSALVKVPVVLGVFRPVILVPVGLLANIPAEQAEAILLHELAHVRRKDYFVNLLQRFADAIFFFNPAFTWISSLLRQEREACCDDLVVAKAGQKRNYVEALVSFQEYSLSNSSPAMAIGTKRNYLLNRVKRILTNENKRLNLLERLSLLAGLIVFGAFTVINKQQQINTAGKAVTQGIQMHYIPVTSADNTVKNLNLPALKSLRPLRSMEGTVSDTIPVKKQSLPVQPSEQKRIPTPPEQEDAAVRAKLKLIEIEQLKQKMQVKKDEIGVVKEKLKTLDKSKESEIEKEKKALDIKRKALEQDREELEKKRVDLKKYQELDKNNKEAIKSKEWEIKQKNWNNTRSEEWETKKEDAKEKQKEDEKEQLEKKIRSKETENEKKQDNRTSKPRTPSKLFVKKDDRKKLFVNDHKALFDKKIKSDTARVLKTETISINGKVVMKKQEWVPVKVELKESLVKPDSKAAMQKPELKYEPKTIKPMPVKPEDKKGYTPKMIEYKTPSPLPAKTNTSHPAEQLHY